MPSLEIKKNLLNWFEENKRDLPWRKNPSPYRIWISEVMLQQTTSKAVIPYYERFLKKFPTLKALSLASEKELMSSWSGLGYYSRAKNLHKSAKILQKTGFPKKASLLRTLPGFGDYTSRAVSSLAFEEEEGVLDGNVIRFLSRFTGKKFEWWKSEDKKKLQALSTSFVKKVSPSQMNQALMEIGSLICKKEKPLCNLCPVHKSCQGLKKGLTDKLPLRRQKKESEMWLLKLQILEKKGKIAFLKNKSLPFLKNELLPPFEFKKLRKKIRDYDFIHSITKYQIFVQVRPVREKKNPDLKWIKISDISKETPSSLIKKALKILNKN